MALTVAIGDPSIQRARNLARVSIVVTISDGQTVLRQETVTHGVNPENGSAKDLLVAGLREKALALKAEVATEQALDARLQSLKADIEAALAQ